MSKELFVKVKEVEGFDHRPEWYRPLAFGKNIYMNMTYLLPGVEFVMGSAREKEEELLERVVYTMSGTIEVKHGEETVVLEPHTVFVVPLAPGLPFVVKNNSQETAGFIVAMSPPPHPEHPVYTRAELIEIYVNNKRTPKSPTEMEEMIQRGK